MIIIWLNYLITYPEAVRSFKTLVVDFLANSLAFLIPWAFRAGSPHLCPFHPMQGAHLWRPPAGVHAGALCHSKDSWKETVTGISTPCIISFLFSHLVRLWNVLDMTLEQMKQTQLLLWHVKWRDRPAVLIFASKLSFMTWKENVQNSASIFSTNESYSGLK